MIIILTLNDYKLKTSIPESDDTVEQDKTITNYIEDATSAIDNYCGGLVYRDYPLISIAPITPANELRIYKLKRALISYTTLLLQTDKMWFNQAQVGGGSAPFSLSTNSGNSQVEYRRQDIIKELVAGGWYKNLRTSGITNDESINSQSELSKLYEELDKRYLRTDGGNTYDASLMTFPNIANMTGVGDIKGTMVVDINTHLLRKPIIFNYNIEVGDDARAKYIWDETTLMYKIINSFPIETWDGLTQTEIIELVNYSINQIGLIWISTINYIKKARVYKITSSGLDVISQTFISNVDNNLNHEPVDGISNEYWSYVIDADVPISEIITMIKPYVDKQVNIQVENIDGLTLGNGLEITTGDVLQTDSSVPLKSGDNVFKGANTFNTLPTTPNAPIQDIDITNKKYVNDEIAKIPIFNYERASMNVTITMSGMWYAPISRNDLISIIPISFNDGYYTMIKFETSSNTSSIRGGAILQDTTTGAFKGNYVGTLQFNYFKPIAIKKASK